MKSYCKRIEKSLPKRLLKQGGPQFESHHFRTTKILRSEFEFQVKTKNSIFWVRVFSVSMADQKDRYRRHPNLGRTKTVGGKNRGRQGLYEKKRPL